MFRIFCLSLVASFLAGSVASAQLLRRPARTVPSQPGTVVPYSGPVVTYDATMTSPTSSALCGQQPCPCGPISGQCGDDCTNPPRITMRPDHCPPSVTCTPIPYEVTPQSPSNCINYPFYGTCVTFKYDVQVPTLREECREVIKFKDVTINFICCDVTVCVPCERCWVKTQNCVMTTKNVDIEACRRQDQTIDVYALNVPGLPKKYVLALKMTEEAFKKAYPGKPLPTYP